MNGNFTDMKKPTADRAYDFIGSLLLEQETNAMLRELEEEKASGTTTEMDAFFAAHEQEHLALIDKYFRKQKTKRFFKKTLPRILQAAAAVFAVAVVFGGAAIAFNQNVRVNIMKIVLQDNPKFLSIDMAEDQNASFDVPATWLGDYYPSYIPEGMRLRQLICQPGIPGGSVVFGGDEEFPKVDFTELSDSGRMNVDSENATQENITINGYPALLLEKTTTFPKRQLKFIIWCDGYRNLVVSSIELPREELIRFAEGIRRIE